MPVEGRINMLDYQQEKPHKHSDIINACISLDDEDPDFSLVHVGRPMLRTDKKNFPGKSKHKPRDFYDLMLWRRLDLASPINVTAMTIIQSFSWPESGYLN